MKQCGWENGPKGAGVMAESPRNLLAFTGCGGCGQGTAKRTGQYPVPYLHISLPRIWNYSPFTVSCMFWRMKMDMLSVRMA